ncbi:MAG: transcription antitermination factor NusB [Chloroflexi bacterium]|nr:transcription antitermination factor NusB [Chloroflexota bacterium]
MKVRRKARAVALQTLYEVDVAGHAAEVVLAQRQEEDDLPEEGVEFARRLVKGAWEHRARLDVLISQIAPEWPVAQMAPIDRNILRLAIYEILHEPETPLKVAINEAVELAKLFGSDSSRRFVNGALGTFAAQPSPRGA